MDGKLLGIDGIEGKPLGVDVDGAGVDVNGAAGALGD